MAHFFWCLNSRNVLPRTLLAATLCVAVLASAGCDRQGNSAGKQPPPPPPTPEESFEQIVQSFRRYIDPGANSGEMGGFATTDERGYSRLQFRTEISDELIPPENPGDNYRGTITVKTQSLYSFRRPLDEDDEEDEKEDEESSESDTKLGELDEFGIGEVPGLLDATPNGKSRSPLPESLLTTQPDEDVRVYELEHVDGRWKLMSELDPELERSIARAFNVALGNKPSLPADASLPSE